MRIGIIGIGGVGGYYGGKLAMKYTGRSKHEVLFYARGAHLAAIRKDGLKLVTVDGEYLVRPAQATDNPAEMGPLDLAIFCTKSYGLEDAARAIAGNLSSDSIVVPLLNGVDITERLRAVLPRGIVLYGGVFISSAIQGPGVVKQMGGTGQLFFGPVDRADVEKYRPIEALLQDAGIKAELSADALLPLWTKYIFIGPMAGVTSLTGKPFGEVLGSPDDRVLVEGMMKEIEAVARKKERQLPCRYRAGIARQGCRLCAGDEDLHAARLRTGQSDGARHLHRLHGEGGQGARHPRAAAQEGVRGTHDARLMSGEGGGFAFLKGSSPAGMGQKGESGKTAQSWMTRSMRTGPADGDPSCLRGVTRRCDG